jgi:hypothetical protein
MNIRVGWLSANYDEWDGSFVYLNARTRFPVTERLFSSGLTSPDRPECLIARGAGSYTSGSPLLWEPAPRAIVFFPGLQIQTQKRRPEPPLACTTLWNPQRFPLTRPRNQSAQVSCL